MAAFRKSTKERGNGQAPVTFRHQDATRIAKTVHAYESGRRDRKPSTLPRATGGGGGGIEEAYFTGGWLKGAVKQITFAPDGQSTTQSTAQAINLIRSIPIDAGAQRTSRVCFVSIRSGQQDSGGEQPQYTLINAEC
jgi:hypothetical protein